MVVHHNRGRRSLIGNVRYQEADTMELTTTQTLLGMKTIKMLKRHMKNRTTPTDKELVALAKVCNANVDNVKSASAVLMGQGVDTLGQAGVFTSSQMEEVMRNIADGVQTHDNFADMATEIVAKLPIDPAAKMLAAAAMGD
jgi:hypothetical protein